ncbi:MAG: GNAT family N-acetyltransferase [Planctomycetota bacterium]
MNTGQTTELVEVLPPGSPLRQQALRLILSGQTRPAPDVDRRIGLLQDTAAGQGMNLDLVVVAFKADQLTAAGLAIESPGRSAFIHLSPLPAPGEEYNALVRVLRELQDRAWRRDRVLLQGMASPDEHPLELLFAEAGFRFLAEFIYADRDGRAPIPSLAREPKLDLLPYSPGRHELFLRALDQTYAESLDCAGLSGIRRTEDALAGHRATGRHDPSLWFLARLSGETAGVLLLSSLSDRNMLEVVYMGVARDLRRRGVGHALMRKCHEEMISGAFAGVTLAVDSVNTPARALYHRWGFVETGRRRAWIAARPS